MGLVSHLCLWVFGFWQGWVSLLSQLGFVSPWFSFVIILYYVKVTFSHARLCMFLHIMLTFLPFFCCFVFSFFFFPDRFKSSTVKECIHAILKEKLANVQYVPEEMPQLTKSLSEIIKDRLKGREACWGSRFFSYCVLSL